MHGDLFLSLLDRSVYVLIKDKSDAPERGGEEENRYVVYTSRVNNRTRTSPTSERIVWFYLVDLTCWVVLRNRAWGWGMPRGKRSLVSLAIRYQRFEKEKKNL